MRDAFIAQLIFIEIIPISKRSNECLENMKSAIEYTLIFSDREFHLEAFRQSIAIVKLFHWNHADRSLISYTNKVVVLH